MTQSSRRCPNYSLKVSAGAVMGGFRKEMEGDTAEIYHILEI